MKNEIKTDFKDAWGVRM